MADNVLVLIDGHALAYRMFYALPLEAFTTKQGEPTNATFGFTRTLMDIILGDNRPEFIAVSFDTGKTFRDDLYPEYKATRAKTPDELRIQMKRIREIVKAFNIPIFEKQGYEADDVLGTIAKQAAEQGIQSRILTGDRDLLQLVGNKISVLLVGRGGLVEYDEQAVKDKLGIWPRQVVDYKALVGDSSDNIPGVRGVGTKTATKLLQQHDDLDTIYQHLDDVSPSRFRVALENGLDDAKLSRKLARIISDVPVDLVVEECRTTDFDQNQVSQLLRALEFRSLGERLRSTQVSAGQMSLFGDAIEQTMETPDTRTVIITSEAELDSLIEHLEATSSISFDTETSSTDEMSADLVGLALAYEPGTAYYIPIGHDLPDDQNRQLPCDLVMDRLRPVLQSGEINKIGHNAKFDRTILARYGVIVTPISFDTMLAAWLLDPASRGLGLKNQAWMHLGWEMTEITQLIGRGVKQISMAQVPIDQAAEYAAADADATLRLSEILRTKLTERDQWNLFTQVEMPLVQVLSEMEMEGIAVDTGFLEDMSKDLKTRLSELVEEIYGEAGHSFNVNSTQQLSTVLFSELGLPTAGLKKTKSGHYSTAAGVLLELRNKHSVIALILEYRELSKLRSTYVDSLPTMVHPETLRIHTSFNPTGAITGRLASSNPNLQNIPVRTELGKQVRRAFVACDGWTFLAADYSQVELRILAHMSGDKALASAFARGEDIHASTASAVFGIPLDQVNPDQRRFAKTINFGLLYGMSAFRLARETDLTLPEAERFVAAYFDSFPGVKGYLANTIKTACDQGWIETALGRRRYFPVLQGKSTERISVLARQRAEREAVNFPIQGTAADIIKIAMIQLHKELAERHLQARLLLQVHDELLLEVPRDELSQTRDIVVQVMKSAYELHPELVVDTKTGSNWRDLN